MGMSHPIFEPNAFIFPTRQQPDCYPGVCILLHHHVYRVINRQAEQRSRLSAVNGNLQQSV